MSPLVTVLRTPVAKPVYVMHFTIGMPIIIDIYYRFFILHNKLSTQAFMWACKTELWGPEP